MGIFDKVKSLFQATDDKEDKKSKIEIEKKKYRAEILKKPLNIKEFKSL